LSSEVQRRRRRRRRRSEERSVLNVFLLFIYYYYPIELIENKIITSINNFIGIYLLLVCVKIIQLNSTPPFLPTLFLIDYKEGGGSVF
jgi:hypothetical protein